MFESVMMSARRAKIQVKPKVMATRSMANKPPPEPEVKTTPADSPPKEALIGHQTKTPMETTPPKPRLTTQITAVADDEDIEIIDTIETKTESQCCDSIDGHKPVFSDDINNNTADKEVVKEATECPTHVKPQDTENMTKLVPKETKPVKEKELCRKRRLTRKANTAKGDKTSMKMKDLLLYNPPMTDEQKEMRDKDMDLTDKPAATDDTETEDKKIEDKREESTTNTTASDTSGGPRVKVGADGLLILDEESVIVKRKKSDTKEEAPVIERAGAVSAFTNYSSFRSKNRGSSKPRWTEHETIRFFSALNTIGTDFTLMADLFFRGKRSRMDLRNKFKKEEKVNKEMIDRALFSPNTFLTNCTQLDQILDSEDSSDDSDDDNTSAKQSAANVTTK
ncbi:unnamed protein product [Medioppia subpectinata]|uniref:Myb-like domain-containing protein n=1 Tax=Medioppia subpectinata TaxID=1979941 RepID=A0A7R9LBJ4_9ACAR|nr:unnamed protein product [Medioppia subpectinata]CAG2117526.1 unnamed protein product [Medioppia subpectinata]